MTFRLLFVLSFLFVAASATAQQQEPFFYHIGSPALRQIWVDPVQGNDGASGATRNQALRTVTAAWNRIPQSTTLTTEGFHILLTRGEFPEAALPNYWEARWGSFSAPIIFEAADGPGTTTFLGDVNMFDGRFIYFINLTIAPSPPGDAFHCERCDHTLLRGVELSGGSGRNAHETLKVNQSRHFYIENSDISGADDNAIDFVAVQYGHVVRTRIHNAEDWCMYAKGGSAYIRVEANEIFNCGTGGFTAGQGTGFEFMDTPWIHHEAENIKFINNIVHDTEGAGFGVNGGYNILLAHNTLYRVGSRSHGLEVVFGERSCDGNTSACSARLGLGGWGTTTGTVPIPNRNVFVYNNVLYNPPGFQSQWQHLAVYAPRSTPAGSNIPSPARADVNLRFGGNVIWNGPADLPLGIGDGEGCDSGNPTCNETQLRGANKFNTLTPDLVSPATGNFAPGTALGAEFGLLIPNFSGGDQEQTPLAPQGVLSNTVSRDFNGAARLESTPRVGALLPGSTGGPVPPPPGTPTTPTNPSPPTTPAPPPEDRSPQLTGLRAGPNLFPNRGGRMSITALVRGATSGSLLMYSYSTGQARLSRLSGSREDRLGIRRFTGNVTFRANRSTSPEVYAVFLFFQNSFGDRLVPLGNSVVLPRAPRRR